MAKLNKETGLYEAEKFINLTNQVIVGTGKTKEEAKEDLKKKIVEYKNNPTIDIADTVHSPGITLVHDENKKLTKVYSDSSRALSYCRADIAEEIREERKKERGKDADRK